MKLGELMSKRFFWLVVLIFLPLSAWGAGANLVKKNFERHRSHFGLKLGINTWEQPGWMVKVTKPGSVFQAAFISIL